MSRPRWALTPISGLRMFQYQDNAFVSGKGARKDERDTMSRQVGRAALHEPWWPVILRRFAHDPQARAEARLGAAVRNTGGQQRAGGEHGSMGVGEGED